MKNAQLTINLSALTYNAKQALNTSPNGVFADVSSNAFNFGLKHATRTFYNAGIRHFTTTSLKEAQLIREWYDDVYILSLNPTTDFNTLRTYRIACTLPSYDFVKAYHQYMSNIEWHVEWAGTGNFSGCRNLKELLETMKVTLEKELSLTGIWTQFSWSNSFENGDKEHHEENYSNEKNTWQNVLDTVLPLYSFTYVHSQNSASFIKEEGLLPHHTHSRLGNYLYGLKPYHNVSDTLLAHAIELQATIINIIHLQAGETFGYNGNFTATTPTRLAIINIGYGDGISRHRLLNQDVIINQKRFKCVSVMRNHIAVIVDNSIDFGHQVLIYSRDIPVHEFSAKLFCSNNEQLSTLNHQTLKINYIL